MNSLRNKFAAWTAVAVLGAASLFAAETRAGGGHHHARMGAFLSKELSLTAEQQTSGEVDLRRRAAIGSSDPAAIETNAAVVAVGGAIQ